MQSLVLLGDGMHMLAAVVLIVKIFMSKSCSDVSGESQILILMTSIARYLDLLTRPVTFYTKSIQLVYVVLSLITIYLIYMAFKSTYSRSQDFNFEYLLIISGFIALLVNYNLKSVHLVWAFAVYLESFSILPQLIMIVRLAQLTSLMSLYLIALFTYRLCVLARVYSNLNGHYDSVAFTAGLNQLVSFFIFFLAYKYMRYVEKRKRMAHMREVSRAFDGSNEDKLDQSTSSADRIPLLSI